MTSHAAQLSSTVLLPSGQKQFIKFSKTYQLCSQEVTAYNVAEEAQGSLLPRLEDILVERVDGKVPHDLYRSRTYAR